MCFKSEVDMSTAHIFRYDQSLIIQKEYQGRQRQHAFHQLDKATSIHITLSLVAQAETMHFYKGTIKK